VQKLLHIGLLVDASRAYGRGICRGVADFAETHDDWLIIPHERPELNELPPWMKGAGLDGVIAYIPNDKLLHKIDSMRIPAVDVHGLCKGSRIPVIESEAVSIVLLALDFLAKAGFRHLAYCGYPGVFFSDQREMAFRKEALVSTKSLHVYKPQARYHAGSDLYQFEKKSPDGGAALAAWLGSLPKPIGLLACNDIRGLQVMNACREQGIRVPEEVSVIGIDNDDVICRLARPTLSSIEPNVRRIGYLAAELIATQLGGGKFPLSHSIAPLRIVERQSTDTVVAHHPLVTRAARTIRNGVSSGQSVEQICESLETSRSTLDKLFHQHLGRSVSAEMTRVRLQYCKNFLINSEQALTEISERCGFSSATYFCRFFKRETGLTPETFRRL
jgi:LacI family transcriptional regulator